MNKVLRGIVLGLGSLALLVLIINFGLRAYHQNKYFKKSPGPTIVKHLEHILNDQNVLAKYSVFSVGTIAKDASAFLHPIIGWSGKRPIVGKLDFHERELPPLEEEEWYAIDLPPHLLEKDVSWFKKLHDYDHWNIDNYRLDVSYSERPTEDERYRPQVLNLLHWVELRLLRGLHDKKPQEGLKDVRHLARLLWTTGYSLNALMTLAILHRENEFVKYVGSKVQWGSIPTEDLQRVERFIRAMPALSDPRLPDALFNKFTQNNAGICQLALEGAREHLLIREYMRHEFQSSFKRMDELVQHSKSFCPETYIHKVWEDLSWSLSKPGKDVEVSDFIFKTTIGYMFANLTVRNNMLEMYELK